LDTIYAEAKEFAADLRRETQIKRKAYEALPHSYWQKNLAGFF
jgi:hypothetical protein